MPDTDRLINKAQGDDIISAIQGITARLQEMYAVDDALSSTSEHPVQNKVVKAALDNKADESDLADKADKSDIASTQTATGNPLTLTDAAPINAESLVVEFSPKQDLHGQSAPYVGGAGKNKLPLDLDTIKSLNTSGTWSGNAYTLYGVTFTVNTDDGGNVSGITISGNATEGVDFFVASNLILTGANILNLSSNKNTTNNDADFYVGGIAIGSSNWISGSANISADTYQTIGIYLNTNYNDTITIHPMIRLSTETDPTFAPWSNICPITGYTECEVDDVGKNILEPTAETQTIGQVTFTKNSDETYTINGTASETIFFYPCGQYASFDMNGKTISGCPSGGSTGSYWFSFSNSNESEFDTGNGAAVTREVSGAPVFIMLQGASLNNAVLKPMICSSSEENPTSYEPYHSSNATIQFGQTVYGGVSDFVNGGTDDEYDYIALASLSWSENGITSSIIEGIATVTGKENGIDNFICDKFKVSTTESEYCLTGRSANNKISLRLPISVASDMTAFNNYLTSVDAHICYEKDTASTLATPPTDLKLLKGTNNLTTNGTTITLGYQPDNVIGEVKGEIQQCIPDPYYMTFDVDSNITDAVPIIFDQATHDYNIVRDGWKDKTFLCIESVDMRMGTLQRILSSDMCFVDSTLKNILLYPYIRAVGQNVELSIIESSGTYKLSYRSTADASATDYIKFRVRVFN